MSNSGPQWLHDFLVAKKVPMPAIRILWALGMRESSGNPGCLYPAGAPWGDWVDGNGRKFDVGVWQVNVVHLDSIRAIYGADKDMSLMLDPGYNFDYTYNHLSKRGTHFIDWGLRATPTGYAFDWSGYPSAWVAQHSAASEAGFTHWWGLWPQYSKTPAPAPVPKPTPAPVVPKKPVIQLSDVQPGDKNSQVKVVQNALRLAGLNPGPADGAFGPKTKSAYAGWQRKLGYTGAAADGAPGRKSLTALGAKYGFTVL